MRCEPISEEQVKRLCLKAREILIEEGNVQLVDSPVTVRVRPLTPPDRPYSLSEPFLTILATFLSRRCHSDLRRHSWAIFRSNGAVQDGRFLSRDKLSVHGYVQLRVPWVHTLIRPSTVGDFVDRGFYSVETFLLLLALKVRYPERITLIRGNHESRQITQVYGFYDECKRRCNVKVWKTFVDTFNTLPIAAIVAGKIFCVHGGLSPSLSHMDDIRNIARPTDVPDYGLLNDLLWSDPADMEADWEANERGVSYCFGKKVIMEFLQKHDFDLVCRAHMVVEDGYEFFNERILVTVFSAPNYCGEFDNWGAVMSVSAELLCSFELLKPLDSSALKSHIKKGRNKRQSMLNSPVSADGSFPDSQYANRSATACEPVPSELLEVFSQPEPVSIACRVRQAIAKAAGPVISTRTDRFDFPLLVV